MIAIVVETAAGRAKVMAGTGSNSTAEAIRLTRFAARAGVDGVAAGGALLQSAESGRPVPPFCRDRRVHRFAAGSLQRAGRTGRNVEPETVERLAAIGPIVAVKEAAGSLDQVSELIARTNLTILSGDDSLTLPMLAVGAEGVVSVVANLVPRDVIALIEAFQNGRIAEARRSPHARLFPLCRDLLGLAPNPIPVKTALASSAEATEKCGCRFARSTSALESC